MASTRWGRIARRWPWLVLALVALGAGIWAFYPRAQFVEVATVTQGRFEQTIREDGRLRVYWTRAR